MADICKLCGRRIIRSSSNWVINDGAMIHKKCPSSSKRLNNLEKEEYDSLREKLAHYASTCPRGYLEDKMMNFPRAMQVVKQMHDRGFSYAEIAFALDIVVKEMDGFWGVKAVDNRIEVIIAKKREKDEKAKNQTMYIADKEGYDDIDLSKITINTEW